MNKRSKNSIRFCRGKYIRDIKLEKTSLILCFESHDANGDDYYDGEYLEIYDSDIMGTRGLSCKENLSQFINSRFLGIEELEVPKNVICSRIVEETRFVYVKTSYGSIELMFTSNHSGYCSGFNINAYFYEGGFE